MKHLTGTLALVRLNLRRERIILPAWILLTALITLGQASQYARLFPTAEARRLAAEQLGATRALSAFAGQIYGTDLGALLVWRIGDFIYCLIAFMAILTVVKHTRAEEEAGRQDLVRAGAVGAYAPLTAGVIVAVGAVCLMALASALGYTVLNLNPIGAFSFGTSQLFIGIIFAFVAAAAAQFTTSARTTTSIAMTILGIAYSLRFIADASGQYWLKFFTPLGWAHMVRPFAGEQWWLYLIMLLSTLLLALITYLLARKRDVGAGIIGERIGPAASNKLNSPFALAWRLQRNGLSWWLFCFALLGIFTGSLATSLPSLTGSNPIIEEFLKRFSGNPQASVIDAYLECIFLSIGITVAFYPILTILRLHAEEVEGHAELLLATPVNRFQWVCSHLVIALAGTLGIMVISGVTAGLTYGYQTGNLIADSTRIFLGALMQIPAAWVMGSIAMFAFGILPRFAMAISWVAWLGISLFGEIIGPIFGINYWVANTISPFHYLPKVISGAHINPINVMGLLGLTVLLTGLGMVGIHKRDIG